MYFGIRDLLFSQNVHKMVEKSEILSHELQIHFAETKKDLFRF